MRLICFWCAVVATAVRAQQEEFYAPQTFRQLPRAVMFQPLDTPWASSQRTSDVVDPYRSAQPQQLFSPAEDVTPQGSTPHSWRPNPAPVYESYNRGSEGPKPEPWRMPHGTSKEQQASILHHKQSLSSEGAFRFEYASDNGLAAGEVIEPDGSRIGAYQYKDPSGQLVKLKYRAGKDGFQILEGSHLPKSPKPVPPSAPSNYYSQAYEQQRNQYDLQQQYNQQQPEPQWRSQGAESQRGGGGAASGIAGAGSQYFNQNWRADGRDDGQYRDNDIEEQNRGPHSFGGGYAFAFKG